MISVPALVSAHSAGVQSLDAQSRGFRFRCRCRDGKSALRSAQLHDFHAVFLLSSGNIVFPAMSRERETTRVRKPLLSSPGSKLLRRFRSRSLMKSVSVDTSCTFESSVCRLIQLLWIAWWTQMCMKPKGIGWYCGPGFLTYVSL